MARPDITDIYDVVDGTWPAARYDIHGPLTFREGQGGGQRVSATTASGPVSEAQLDEAEAKMRAMNQPALFMIRDGQDDLDAQLDARGYAIHDPVNAYVCPVETLMGEPVPPVTVIPVWEPLALMIDIWAEGGIGEGRIAVMHRAKGPKTGLIARWRDHPGGCAFVAIHNGVAMLHAVEILADQRNQGLGKWVMRRAAFWAAKQGATHVSVVCTHANAAANALYSSLGMTLVGRYHYRKFVEE